MAVCILIANSLTKRLFILPDGVMKASKESMKNTLRNCL
jgi:hypothetical protein